MGTISRLRRLEEALSFKPGIFKNYSDLEKALRINHVLTFGDPKTEAYQRLKRLIDVVKKRVPKKGNEVFRLN